MSVYEMNRRAVAEYLSNTINEFVIGCKQSKEGRRVDEHGSSYPIQIKSISTVKGIKPQVDCFLNINGTTAVRVYIPRYNYYIKTRELHSAYGGNGELQFNFVAEPYSFMYTMPKKDVSSFEDFAEVMSELTERTSAAISKRINEFKPDEDGRRDGWTIKGIKLNVTFDIYSFNG